MEKGSADSEQAVLRTTKPCRTRIQLLSYRWDRTGIANCTLFAACSRIWLQLSVLSVARTSIYGAFVMRGSGVRVT